eukprot:TRINITY_DN80757_c0_g1_i1.p1 TRINITY_DN80757_c0_g1~~TRINITY_DN80757_c0_g1_i1.p1  ORF type:complete len:405 (+),score=89.38 TRINITY_DN80757_c0_g1_i1:44-1258(+)
MESYIFYYYAMDSAVIFLLALLVGLLSTWVVWRPRRPQLLGGTAIRASLASKVETLVRPQTFLQPPGLVQLILVALSNIIGSRFCWFLFTREEIPVRLPGDSALKAVDKVALEWLKHEWQPNLPKNAPIVFIVPGLANSKESLPGQSLYAALLKKSWRTVVFEKRGVGTGRGKLRAPVFHIFGHPSDLAEAVGRVVDAYPEAPLHFVSFSAGNGLLGSYFKHYPEQTGGLVRSVLMLKGGEDYNVAFKLRGTWIEGMVHERLLTFLKQYFVKSNEEVLKAHNADAFKAALETTNMEDFYALTMRHFSGYEDPDEAERLINGFNGGNKWMEANTIPLLAVYTEDDHVSWQRHPEWMETFHNSSHNLAAVFQYGSHCACFEGLFGRSRWLDRLVVEWIEAVEKDSA